MSTATMTCNLAKTHGGYVARLVGSTSSGTRSRNCGVLPTPILIVDVSGSMGSHAQKLIGDILPKTLRGLKYASDAEVHLITFSCKTYHSVHTCATLRQAKFTQGGTSMAKVPDAVMSILSKRGASDKGYLLLTVSDGQIGDREATTENAAKVALATKGVASSISSHAIRFQVRDYGSADTHALSSLLQLDNTGLQVGIAEISSSLREDQMVARLVETVSRGGGIGSISTALLKVQDAELRRFPWEKRGKGHTSTLAVNAINDVFWLDSVPTNMTLDGVNVPVTVVAPDTVDRETYQRTLGKHLDGFLQRAKILKLVDTETAKAQLNDMMAYFSALEQTWFHAEDASQRKEDETDSTIPALVLRSKRLKRSLAKTSMSLRYRLSTIINDGKVGEMNASQQADYLRNVDLSKTGKGLARRAAASDGSFDFDTVMRKEVRNMRDHLDELADVDDSDHMVSFYSRATTLDGIKTICELADDGTLDDVSTTQIIELFNIVGFPCDAPIGDFPDSSTYWIKEVYTVCNVSLADVLVYSVESGGQTMQTPATGKDIINVVPVFEDERIARFLRKYAGTLLEYVASVGMRRVIADVPLSLGYTILSGVAKMLAVLGRPDVSESSIRTFLHVVTQLPATIGRAFAGTISLLDHPNDDDRLAYHLAHNGVNEMLYALLQGLKLKKISETKMGKILRALYSYETFQIVRKSYRHENGKLEQMLHAFLDVDFDKWRVPVTPLFEANIPADDVPATWPSKISSTEKGRLMTRCSYLDTITYIPEMFSIAVLDTNLDEKVARFKAIPVFDDKHKADVLGVTSISDFRDTVLLQAFTYTTKKSRVDEVTELPLLPDPGNAAEAESLLATTLRRIYVQQYKNDLAIKSGKEDELLIKMLVDKLLSATSMTEFGKLINNGVTKGCRTMNMVNSSSAAFQALSAVIFNEGSDIPLQAEKMFFLISGSMPNQNGDEMSWNNGNMLLPLRKTWETTFKVLDRETMWSELYKMHKERIHQYRSLKNRHGHGNDKPSYSAFGYPTMDAMRKEVSAEAWENYLKSHVNCCGCSGGEYVSPAAKVVCV